MESVTLVLLPGLDGTGRLFAPLLSVLPLWVKPLVISYPPDTFLDYSALQIYVRRQLPDDIPCVLLGESFAGPLAITLAATSPPNLKALILCATFATNPTIVPAFAGKLIFNRFLFGIPPPEMIVRWLLVGADASPNLVRLVQKVIVSVPPTLMASRTQEVLHCDVRDVLQQITLPTLYLRAARDKIVRAGALREILELQPQAKVEKLDGPHFLLQREPEAAAQIIEAFLEKCMDE